METASAYQAISMNLEGSRSEDPERLNVWKVNATFLSTLGVRPQLGRDFLPYEDTPGGRRAALLSYPLWQRRFGSDSGIVGRPVTLDGNAYSVVGVLPASFEIAGRKVDLYVPLALANTGRDGFATGAGVARLKPGVALVQAQAETRIISNRLTEAFFHAGGRTLRLWGMREFLVRDVRLSLLILMGAVALVLLIACANVANLLLARAGARSKEIAIRATLGAGRGRLIRQLLTESALLGLAGGGMALLVAHWGVRLLTAVSPERYPLLAGVRTDLPVLWFTLTISLLTSLLFGLVPALSVSHGATHAALKEGGRSGGDGSQGRRLRDLLVTAEVALALVLAIGAGLLLTAFLRLEQVNPGFRADGLLTASLDLPARKYPQNVSRLTLFDALLRSLAVVPGIKDVGMVSIMPLSGSNSGTNIHLEGRPVSHAEDAPVVWFRAASPGYFRAMAIPLRAGRYFDDRDASGAPPVVIVNETLARRFWPSEDPVGKRLGFGLSHQPAAPGQPEPSWLTVVGVVGDVRHTSLAQPPEAELFTAYTQTPGPSMQLAIRASAEPTRIAPLLRKAVAALDKDLPVSRIAGMQQIVADSLADRRLSMRLLGSFAALAVILAAVGIYGLISYSVTRRTHEIGVRLALGAARGHVLRLIVLQGLTPALAGLAIGLAAALLLTRVMRTLLYGVTATDPLIFGGVTVILAVVAALASYLPARRATKVDPMVALRYE
jgi:putative ABC transport system permease protein